MKRFTVRAACVLLVLGVVFFAGPRAKVDTTQRPGPLPADLEGYLAESESRFPGLRPGTEKTIVWADPQTKARTAIAVVYLHGFSATRQEVRPLPDIIAGRLGANLFYTRMSGHGRGDDAMAEPEVGDWIRDGYEALAIGARLGDRIILMGTSTGATLAAWLAAQTDAPNLLALVLISPNFRPKDGKAGLLLWPWGRQIARLVAGPYYSWQPHNADHRRYWTSHYPSRSLVTMMNLVDLTARTDLARVQAPVLVFYSPDDRVVNPLEIERRFPKFGAVEKELVPITSAGDPSNHVLAGDILSPQQTQPIAERALAFLEPLAMRAP